jgi:hypothetical protein
MKSSITGERIKKDPVFKAFRKSSGRMSEASPIASFVYQQLPVKNYPLYREMTGKAILWLKEGVAATVILDRLSKEYLQALKPKRNKMRSIIKLTPRLQPAFIVTSERVKGCDAGRTQVERRLDSLRTCYSG